MSILDPIRALSHGGLRSMGLVAVFYNFGFFTILAYTPFLLGLTTHQLGIVYFGWGLLVAITSVFVAQRLERRFGLVMVLGVALSGVAVDLLAGGVLAHSVAGLIVVVVVSGGLLGIVNTVLTEAVMAAAVVERPIASSAYSFVRFTGGAIAPWVAGKVGEHVSAPGPMYLGGGMVVLSVVTLVLSRHHLRHEAPEVELPATPPALPAGAILVAVDGSGAAGAVVDTAIRVARSRAATVHVVHVRETRTLGEDAADLEDRSAARAVLDRALERVRAAGVAVTGEVLHVTGHHKAAAEAVLALADRTEPSAVVVGRPGAHGGEPGARSLTAILTERAPCDVVVVAAARRLVPVAA